MPKRVVNATAATGAEKFVGGDPYEYFPTPPWCTRALFRVVFPELARILAKTNPDDFRIPWLIGDAPMNAAIDVSAGEGYMARVLSEFVHRAYAGDVKDYGYSGGDWNVAPVWEGGTVAHPVEWNGLQDFLDRDWRPPATPFGKIDLYCNNPPFSPADEFIRKCLGLAGVAVSCFIRLQFGEGEERFRELWRPYPPAIEAVFAERCNLVSGTVDPKASRPTSYAWFVWLIERDLGKPQPLASDPVPCWPKIIIPPGTRAKLERRSTDYREPPFRIRKPDQPTGLF